MSAQFTTMVNQPLEFLTEGGPIHATEGEFSDFHRELSHYQKYLDRPELRMECAKGESVQALEEGIPIPKTKPRTLGQLGGGSSVTDGSSPDHAGGPSSLSDLLKDKDAVKPVDLAPKPADKDVVPKPPADVAKPADKDLKNAPPSELAQTITPACDKAQLASLAAGTALHSPQMVGMRNSRNEADGFDYLSTVADAVPLDSAVDISDSRAKLVPYDTLGATADSLWVTLSGVDVARLKAKTEAPAKLLRLVVVGGAPEIVMSGLDLVGAQLNAMLKRGGQSSIRIDAEWYSADASGAIASVGHYDSLDKLVKAATDKAAGRPPDQLNEKEMLGLIDAFESMLKSRTQPVDKVFWIKGAYPIGSSIPPRFEKFITDVSASNAVPHLPSGQPAKWLVLVSARTAGFSLNYLKEPIYSQEIGDVIEESPDAPRARARQFIAGDTVQVLAARLQTAAVAVPATDAPANRKTVTGQLVFKAADIFDSRGYVLSPEAIAALPDHLHHIADYLRKITPPSGEDRRALLGKIDKPVPTLADIIQDGDAGGYPRLPKILPEWAARKGLDDLSDQDNHEAQVFIDAYWKGAEAVAGEMAKLSEKSDGMSCGLFYVPEARFGFGKR